MWCAKWVTLLMRSRWMPWYPCVSLKLEKRRKTSFSCTLASFQILSWPFASFLVFYHLFVSSRFFFVSYFVIFMPFCVISCIYVFVSFRVSVFSCISCLFPVFSFSNTVFSYPFVSLRVFSCLFSSFSDLFEF